MEKHSSNFAKFMRILLKIFYHGLELVSDEKQQIFLTRGLVSLGFKYIAYVVVDSPITGTVSPQSKQL